MNLVVCGTYDRRLACAFLRFRIDYKADINNVAVTESRTIIDHKVTEVLLIILFEIKSKPDLE